MNRKQFIKNYVNQTGKNKYNGVTLLKGLHYNKILKRIWEIAREKVDHDCVGLVDHLKVDGPDTFPRVLYKEDEKEIDYTETLINLMIEIENDRDTEFICIPHYDWGHENAVLFGIESFSYDDCTPMSNNLYKAEKICDYLKWKDWQVGIQPPEIK